MSFAKVNCTPYFDRAANSHSLQIAAAGRKPTSPPQAASHENGTDQHITSSPRDGTNIVSHSTGSYPPQFTPKQKKLVPLMPKGQKETESANTSELQVSVHNVDSSSPPGATPRAADGMLTPALDEASTQLSSSSGSGKPPSLDGKSIASGTTFALDEKESLRPDDSASVKDGEDEDLFSAPGSGLPGSRMGSDDGSKAFRDQLREISRMEPARSSEPPQPNIARGGPSHGILYVPPQGPGVGAVPGSNRTLTEPEQASDYPPDPKLLEALESQKDRIMVLKLEQDFVDFVKDSSEASLVLPQLNAYHRMLAHKLAEYYMLGHIVEDSMAVQIYKTSSCRLAPPLTAVVPPSTAASTPPPTGPQMKILRRGVDGTGPTIANGSNSASKTGSENGESGNDDDRKSKYPLSREEREARYETARKRIMGASRPSDSIDEQAQKDNSRSSSTAPKKAKKKQRNPSDDDFEARSAYSAYYTTPFTPTSSQPASFGFQPTGHAQNNHYAQSNYGAQAVAHGGQQYGIPANGAWSYQTPSNTSNWLPSAQQGYDLANDFQRTLSLQQQTGSMPTNLQQPSIQSQMTTNVHSNMPYANIAQPGWQSHQAQRFPTSQASQPQSPHTSGYPPQGYSEPYRPQSAKSQSQLQDRPYAFGQLPSQTYPGRLPNSLEHPLPGSYKGKHFNPQSQSFVPNFTASPVTSTNVQSYVPGSPSVQQSVGQGYGVPGQMQRQNSFPQQQTSHALPQSAFSQQNAPVNPSPNLPIPTLAGAHRSPSFPMTHPLPQPVFPQQPSPNMPLPPKPDATPPTLGERYGGSASGAQINSVSASNTIGVPQRESTIAKWGAPPSLPAKPPPPAEPYDVMRYAQGQRQPSYGARVAGNVAGLGSSPASVGVVGSGVVQPTRKL